MDTVHGTRSGKVLLRFVFRNCSLMIAFILDSCSQIAVNEIMDKLYAVLGQDVFKRSFPTILTDNGSVFKSPEVFELDSEGNESLLIIELKKILP